MEEALSAAVNALVRARPVAPITFLARHLVMQVGLTAALDVAAKVRRVSCR